MDYKKDAVFLIDEFKERYTGHKQAFASWNILTSLVIGKAIVFALLQIASNLNNIADEIKRKN